MTQGQIDQTEAATLLGLCAKNGVIPQEVAFEILGALMNDGKPRFSRLREWVEMDVPELAHTGD